MEYTQNTVRGSKIEENQWAVFNELNFSTFTSCIGVVGHKKGSNGNLFGIHLVQAVDDFFKSNDAKKVAKLINDNCEPGSVKIFGCLDMWQGKEAYEMLKEMLKKSLKKPVTIVASPKGDGTYRATFNTVNSNIDIVKS